MQLPRYKDASAPVEERVEDLLGRMTLEEKAGQLFHAILTLSDDYQFEEGSDGDKLITNNLLTHFNLLGNIKDMTRAAGFLNQAQARSMSSRLGIPISFSTDPRHSFTQNLGLGFPADAFSQWPEMPGFAALRDPELVGRFAEIARQEYLALGFRIALSPQIDLCTDPRWARSSGTFGEDADLTIELLKAYIRGFQGTEGPGPTTISTITKHFPGAGPKENGEDAHFHYGKNQVYPAGQFDYHLAPFKAAIAAGTRGMMPYYSKPVGTEYEEVGFSYNRQIITGLLRETLGFDGIVLTDWGIITDDQIFGEVLPARAWGMEKATVTERLAKVLNAGCDQFGGECETELLIKAVQDGIISEERLDVSVRKLLREKFLLGLFEAPYVDIEKTARMADNSYFRSLGLDVQRRSFTLLTNKNDVLPLQANSANLQKGVYLENIDPALLTSRGLRVVATPEEAGIALLRLQTPYREGTTLFEKLFHAGSLEFSDEEKQRQAKIFSTVPTIVDIKVERPPAIPEIAKKAAALLGSYGSADEAFLDIVFGDASPEGRLPFDLPRSDAAVEASREDAPFDTKDPVFRFGHGLRYEAKKETIH